ncbi:hypothetical protein C8Q74DRAFT_1287700 [Fomes fomentarius]|nr:hypothetical protein C8Q74DRAFT_1287700 [Fomes fomentarius]
MRALEDGRAAEEFQLNEALVNSALAAGRFPKKVAVAQRKTSGTVGRTDEDVVLDVLAAEISANKNAAVAQALQHADDSNMAASRQYAQKLAAAEKKYALDAEFARQLQEAIDNGDDDDDDLDMRDAESVLGQDAIESILASDMNAKGKGKPKKKGQAIPSYEPGPTLKKEDGAPTPTCGICMETFQATHSPVAASRSANSSSRLQFGTYLPCPRSHGYCHSCLNGYINSKLDPDGTGVGSQSNVVFPIRCPECSIAEWPDGIPNGIAERVLSEKGMNLWHHQKLLDSLPKYYCPNPRCSALVQVDEDSEDPQAICPSCDEVICVPCRVLWHEDLTCEEYQALPLDERSPDDQKALQLMKAKNWRRCPKCAIIVELTVGCNHMTCLCKTQFCFKCGALWNAREGRCSRKPSCELWDEELLLEERERQREREHQARVQGQVQNRLVAPAPVRFDPLPPPPPYHPVAVDDDIPDLSWMEDDDVLCKRHWFTSNMINSLICQYCDASLNSLADLRYHLTNVRRHAVYACCGRFFKRDVDFERHQDADNLKYGWHIHTVRRD